MSLLQNLIRKGRLFERYITSHMQAPRYHRDFENAEKFCMFLGYPRSGHSLVGALLDAHPEIIISHELHALRYIRYHFSRDQLYYAILDNSRTQAAAGRSATGYSYTVPNQWQGRYRQLRVIGDKRGGTSVRKLRLHPHLLQRLRNTVGVPIKFIHVTRNPFDNIATMFRRAHHPTLRDSIEHYFYMVEGVAQLRREIAPEDLFEIAHESIIADPRHQLTNLCTFLGVRAPEDFLSDCASIVYAKPNQTRKHSVWTPERIDEIHTRIKQYPFLAAYHFEK